MFRHILVAAVAASCLASAQVGVGDTEGMGVNHVVNPSFEQPAKGTSLSDGWLGPPTVFSRDSETARTGKASLKYASTDAARNGHCTQDLPLRPGWTCRFGVWVKTKELAGPGPGASICIEWTEKKGKWLGGAYSTWLKGTCDWTRIEGVAHVPENAGSVRLYCAVRKVTGAAWFDDVEVIRTAEPILQTRLLSPAYRELITAAMPDEVRVRLHLNLIDYDFQAQDLRVEARLCDEAGNPAPSQAHMEPGDKDLAQFNFAGRNSADLVSSTRGLKPGNYDLAIHLLGPEGKKLQTARHRLVRMPDDFRPRCIIDGHRRLLLDGQPFFPLGMYWSGINEKDLKIYTESKFNCLMPYGPPNQAQMDLAQKYGMKVIYSIKDFFAGHGSTSIKTEADEEPAIRQRVRAMRDHPALLAWYLADETPRQFLPRLEAHQRWVAEEDPHHPTWVVLCQPGEVGLFLKTFDVIGTDPYPIGRSAPSLAAGWTAETFRQVRGERPIWQVPQAHSWVNYVGANAPGWKPRTPTTEEVRSMAWQCIAEGATGLVFYSFYDVQRNPDVPFDVQWKGLKEIAAQIDRLAPVLLSVERVPEVQVRAEPPAKEKPEWLHCLARSHGGKLYLIAVNDGDGEGRVTFTLPPQVRTVRMLDADKPLPLDKSVFQDDFRKLDVRIYEAQ